MSSKTKTWSYSHFLHRLYEPFDKELDNVDNLLENYDTADKMNSLLDRIMEKCLQLEAQMSNEKITLRPNKMFIHSFDVVYEYPDDHNFMGMCHEYIKSSAVVVFQHLCNFKLIKLCLGIYDQKLSTAQHPLTGDTMWHLSPHIMDMVDASINNLYNFRDETPNQRHMMSTMFNLHPVVKFQHDIDNTWNIDTRIYVDKKLPPPPKDPMTMSRIIKRHCGVPLTRPCKPH